MLRSVAVLAVDGLPPFEFGVACEVFGIDRRDTGGPAFDFRIVTAHPGAVRTSMGFTMTIVDGLERARGVDLIVVPAHGTEAVIDPAYLDLLRQEHARGTTILSICSGAFTLAATGLLDGRRAATHWMHADLLHERHPSITVDPDVLFVDEGSLITSAGTSAGIDAALHLVRRELGAGAANAIARRMVIPAQREGGQAQYIKAPVPERRADSLAAVTDWMLENLDRDLTVDELARRALMSPRTFARRFRADVGATPLAWLNRQRLLRAQHLLEETDLTLDAIAQRTGFGSAAVLRHHFARTLRTTPTAYRSAFAA
ncbi:GlxA family transcriptional regulator [Frondihabitans australicus]|uniref:Transcriptional regulator GlxA family with amidase domain n=1 Tax=Frondihabitans australicus TaxID=386892 RepID=A0A495IB75_9MICO|nr:helix-turn-helix domain-containing protein [Frondihabitans australicus]RKR73257.1 transcriptional regulator GlxA family with amidase domain [Frondihabitans australicus]